MLLVILKHPRFQNLPLCNLKPWFEALDIVHFNILGPAKVPWYLSVHV